MTTARIETDFLAGPKSRLTSLTGMRWIAAMLVFATHAGWQPGMLPAGADAVKFAVKMGGYVGVGFFFMLSGFVLTWSMRPDDTAGRFLRRRFFKIYPNHLVTFLLALGFLTMAGMPIIGVLPNLLLAHAWVPDLKVAFGVNDVSWSLSVEACLYLSFPLLIALIRKIAPDRLWWWACGLAAAVLCMPLVATLLPDDPKVYWEPTPEMHYWFVYVFPPVRLLDFALGIVTARMVMTGRWPKVNPWFAAALFAAGYVVSLYVPTVWGAVAATVIPLAVLIPTMAAAELDGRRWFVGSPVMVWLGDISFAFYMVHQMVLYSLYPMYGADFSPSVLQSAGLILGALAVTVLLSWVLYRAVEVPVYRRFATARARG